MQTRSLRLLGLTSAHERGRLPETELGWTLPSLGRLEAAEIEGPGQLRSDSMGPSKKRPDLVSVNEA